MRTLSMVFLAFALSAPSWVPVAGAQNTSAPAGAPPAQTTKTATPVVSEQANLLLRQMAAYIGSAEQFTFHANITFDHVLPSGQKLQYSATEDVAMQRPSGLYVEWSGDLGDRQFWYDGKSVTLYDPATPFYASEAAPSRLDDMLETLVTHLASRRRLPTCCTATRISECTATSSMASISGQTDVNGQSCHALAFVEKDIDWQIWISAGPQLVPCKLVITYKTQPSQPQFTAVFTDWDFDAAHRGGGVYAGPPSGRCEKSRSQTVAAAK